MPRRLPVRPAKIIGNLFVLFVMTVIAFQYYTFVFLVWGPRSIGKLFAISNVKLFRNRQLRSHDFTCILSLILCNVSLVFLLIYDY